LTDERFAILELMYSWCYVIDNGRWPEYEGLFTPDAKLDFSSVGSEGSDPHTHLEFLEKKAWPATKTQHHHMGNTVFLELSDDAARTRSTCVASIVMSDDSFFSIGVYYHDRFTRTSDGWLFTERRCEKVFFNPPGDVAGLATGAE
jgi:hypothetical protein